MKVSELIAQLQKLPLDSNVIMSSDAEGNDHHNVDCAEEVDEKTVVIVPLHDNVELNEDW